MYRIFIMGFYLSCQYIHTKSGEKEVQRDMYATLSYFLGSDDYYGYEKWECNYEAFFSYFILTSEQK